MTQFEKLQKMTAAEFVDTTYDGVCPMRIFKHCKPHWYNTYKGNCDTCWRDWLISEAEETDANV